MRSTSSRSIGSLSERQPLDLVGGQRQRRVGAEFGPSLGREETIGRIFLGRSKLVHRVSCPPTVSPFRPRRLFGDARPRRCGARVRPAHRPAERRRAPARPANDREDRHFPKRGPLSSPVTAAITVSTASSPSFCAALSMPPANSFAVHESGSPERARSAMICFQIGQRKFGHARARLRTVRRRRVQPHRQAGFGHMRLGLAQSNRCRNGRSRRPAPPSHGRRECPRPGGRACRRRRTR